MLRVGLTIQLRRLRSAILLVLLTGLPVLAAATESGHAAATYSAINFAESGLNFMDPVLFGVAAALLGSYFGGSDREWGTLRYRYVRPVSPGRLLAGQWWALLITMVLTVLIFLVAAVVAGYAAFGWHTYHRESGGSLANPAAMAALLLSVGYLTVCLLSIGAIALALGMLLPRPVEALAICVTFVVGSAMVDGIGSLQWLVGILPVHYWMRWTQLFEHGGVGAIAVGCVVQAVWILIALGAAQLLGSRRDPMA